MAGLDSLAAMAFASAASSSGITSSRSRTSASPANDVQRGVSSSSLLQVRQRVEVRIVAARFDTAQKKHAPTSRLYLRSSVSAIQAAVSSAGSRVRPARCSSVSAPACAVACSRLPAPSSMRCRQKTPTMSSTQRDVFGTVVASAAARLGRDHHRNAQHPSKP